MRLGEKTSEAVQETRHEKSLCKFLWSQWETDQEPKLENFCEINFVLFVKTANKTSSVQLET